MRDSPLESPKALFSRAATTYHEDVGASCLAPFVVEPVIAAIRLHVCVRRWDDCGKVAGWMIPRPETYRAECEACMLFK